MKTRHVFALTALLTLAAAACDKSSEPAAHASTASTGAPSAPSAEGRVIEISATNEGYSPKVVEAKKGEKLVLRFTRKTKSGCLEQVVFPEQNIKKDLPIDKPVDIAITA